MVAGSTYSYHLAILFRFPAKPLWQLLPKSLPITLFLATVVIETIVDLALQGDIYFRLRALAESDDSSKDQARRISVYLAIFALAQSVFAFHPLDCISNTPTAFSS